MARCNSAVLQFELLKALSQELSIPPKILEEDFRRLGTKTALEPKSAKKLIASTLCARHVPQ